MTISPTQLTRKAAVTGIHVRTFDLFSLYIEGAVSLVYIIFIDYYCHTKTDAVCVCHVLHFPLEYVMESHSVAGSSIPYHFIATDVDSDHKGSCVTFSCNLVATDGVGARSAKSG